MTNDSSRPLRRHTVSREELFRQVWETPMSRLAVQYGISGNGLSKICDRLNVPCPPRGYWAKKAAGQKVIKYRLPPPKSETPAHAIITPTAPSPKPPELPKVFKEKVESVRTDSGSIVVADRLLRPHKVIAAWLEEHERKKREARKERNPDVRRRIEPAEITETVARQHRILDALFKALERHGGTVKQNSRQELLVELEGVKIEFVIREKHKQGRRDLTQSEKLFSSRRDKGWRQVLIPTGVLVFAIKTYLPHGLKREWVESEKVSMESLLPDIVTTMISAGSLLVEQRRKSQEEARQRQLAERLRHEEEQRRRRDDNRWGRFVRLAQQQHEVEMAQRFLEAIRRLDMDPATSIDGQTIAEWIEWAEEHIARTDPLNAGVEAIFRALANVTS